MFTSQDAVAADRALAPAADGGARAPRRRRRLRPAARTRRRAARRTGSSSTSCTALSRGRNAGERRRAHLRADAVLERELGDPAADLGGVPVRRRRRDERGPGVVAADAPRGAHDRLRAARRCPPLARVFAP